MDGTDAFCEGNSEKEVMVRSMDLILKPWGATEGFKQGSDTLERCSGNILGNRWSLITDRDGEEVVVVKGAAGSGLP